MQPKKRTSQNTLAVHVEEQLAMPGANFAPQFKVWLEMKLLFRAWIMCCSSDWMFVCNSGFCIHGSSSDTLDFVDSLPYDLNFQLSSADAMFRVSSASSTATTPRLSCGIHRPHPVFSRPLGLLTL